MRPRSPAPAAIGPPSDPQQLMVRRAAAVGIGAARRPAARLRHQGLPQRRQGAVAEGLQPRRVGSLIQDADANTEDFFGTLAGEVERHRLLDRRAVRDQPAAPAARQALTKRAEELDVPGDMRPAQRQPAALAVAAAGGDRQGRREAPRGAVDRLRHRGARRARDRRRDARLRRRRRRLQPPHGGAHQAGARRQRDRRAGHPELELPAEPRLAAALDGRQAHRLPGRPRRRRRRLDGAGARAARPRPGRAQRRRHDAHARRGQQHHARRRT